MKTAFVTGVTSGFGKAFALRLAKLGYRLVITGRRADRLEHLATQIKTDYQTEVKTLCFDVRDNEACVKAIESLDDNFKNIDLLVNNAGLAAGSAPFDQSDLNDFERMLDTNVKGLLYISKLIVPMNRG